MSNEQKSKEQGARGNEQTIMSKEIEQLLKTANCKLQLKTHNFQPTTNN